MAAPPGRGTGCFEGNSCFDPPGPSHQSYCDGSALTRPNAAQRVPALIEHLGPQFDVLLACRFALGVLPDPGFPATSVRHVASRKGNPGDIGVPAGRSPSGTP